jgi:cell division protein FtsB
MHLTANYFAIALRLSAEKCISLSVSSSISRPLMFQSTKMSAGQSIWDKLFRLVLALLVMASLMGIFLWYRPVIEQNQELRRKKLDLEGKIDIEIENAKKLDAQFRAMQSPTTIERLARERLSYAKPGENVIHFDPAPGTTQTP